MILRCQTIHYLVTHPLKGIESWSVGETRSDVVGKRAELMNRYNSFELMQEAMMVNI